MKHYSPWYMKEKVEEIKDDPPLSYDGKVLRKGLRYECACGVFASPMDGVWIPTSPRIDCTACKETEAYKEDLIQMEVGQLTESEWEAISRKKV